MMAGWMLLEEKYDADKNGILSDAEMKTLKADAEKALEAKKAQTKAAREANKPGAEQQN